jgi:hypothetical protein
MEKTPPSLRNQRSEPRRTIERWEMQPMVSLILVTVQFARPGPLK